MTLRGAAYQSALAEFRALLPAGIEPLRSELMFESLDDRSLFGPVQAVRDWYESSRAACTMVVDPIPLAECRQWAICPETGSMVHDSGAFFRVDGLRVGNSTDREVVGGWDQPILTQVGYDGGILGLVRKRIDAVPHYLVEAKAEPGNYNLVQITTTIQATFSNLARAHKGKGTPYAELFTEPDAHGAEVLVDIWMSEDGGRLNHKRNRTMMVEISEGVDLRLVAERYRWVSWHQLRTILMTDDAIVAPHLRGLLCLG
jgi:dTDP-4-dehydro-6-deoxy-alpha-D-glucopyranose 2,3-dehydratase